MSAIPDFDAPELARAVETLSPQEIDALPFGAIRLNEAGLVTFYSEAERKLSGSGDRTRLGREFFGQIAPCMDNEAFRGRIEEAKRRGTLDLEFTHIGDFDDRDRELTVRIQSAAGGGVWIFLRREG